VRVRPGLDRGVKLRLAGEGPERRLGGAGLSEARERQEAVARARRKAGMAGPPLLFRSPALNGACARNGLSGRASIMAR
jgi:hypothetical protein